MYECITTWGFCSIQLNMGGKGFSNHEFCFYLGFTQHPNIFVDSRSKCDVLNDTLPHKISINVKNKKEIISQGHFFKISLHLKPFQTITMLNIRASSWTSIHHLGGTCFSNTAYQWNISSLNLRQIVAWPAQVKRELKPRSSDLHLSYFGETVW